MPMIGVPFTARMEGEREWAPGSGPRAAGFCVCALKNQVQERVCMLVHGELLNSWDFRRMSRSCWDCAVPDLVVLVLHLLATVARVVGPGGARSIVAESLLVKHQLLILNRSRKRSPNLRLSDRVVAGVCALLMRPHRLIRCAIVFKPSTLLRLHRVLTQSKYRRILSSTVPTNHGAHRSSDEIIA